MNLCPDVLPLMVSRRYNFDVLRVVCTGSVFLVHCFCIFAVSTFYVFNAQLNVVLYVLVFLMLVWIMPVFFIISGRVTYTRLVRPSALRLVKDRFRRYMIPLLLGVFTFCAVIIYLRRVFYHEYIGSLWSFYVNEYFHGLYGFGGNFSFLGNHLWYLAYLFLFTVLVLVIVRLLPIRKWWPTFHRWLSVFQRPGAVFLLVVPVILTTQVNFLEPTLLGRTETGSWNVLTYFVFFALGLLFAADARFDEVIDRHWKASAVLTVPLLAVYTWLMLDASLYNQLASWMISLLLGLTVFTTVLALFGCAHRMVREKPRHIERLTEAVMPFYVLHFPIVITYGFFIVQLHLDLLSKLGLIIGLSFLTVIALYEVIKRVNFLRFLFGMKMTV